MLSLKRDPDGQGAIAVCAGNCLFFPPCEGDQPPLRPEGCAAGWGKKTGRGLSQWLLHPLLSVTQASPGWGLSWLSVPFCPHTGSPRTQGAGSRRLGVTLLPGFLKLFPTTAHLSIATLSRNFYFGIYFSHKMIKSMLRIPQSVCGRVLSCVCRSVEDPRMQRAC